MINPKSAYENDPWALWLRVGGCGLGATAQSPEPRVPSAVQRFARGFLMAEYAVLVAATVAALLAMAVYMRRAMAGRLRDAAEQIGEQYDPRRTSGSRTAQSSGGRTVTDTALRPVVVSGSTVLASQSTTTMLTPQENRTEVSETVGPFAPDIWQ